MKGLTILIPNDDPSGLKIVELNGWNGKVFVVPRKNLKSLSERSEVSNFGLYFIIGEGDDPSRRKVYIGESRNVFERLANHDAVKEFWETAIVFTGMNFDKSDVEYLETKSVILAKEANRYEILNSSGTHHDQLSEFKKSALDDYFEKVKFILALLDVALFQKPPKERQTGEIYYLEDANNKDASAKGALLETGEFIVFAGSKARVREVESFANVKSSVNMRRKLEAEEILKKEENGKSFIFTQDHIFRSPSAASDVVLGRGSNGWTSWKDEKGKTLDENKRK